MSKLSPDELTAFMHVAEDIAREARHVIIRRFGEGLTYRLKDDGSFVTDVDLAVEDLVRARLGAAFPEHGILGEERSDTLAQSEYQWIIDPIDGTKSLRHRIPLFGTLLALRHAGRPVVGLIDWPMLNRTFVAASGLGAYSNGQRLHLRDVQDSQEVAREVIAVGERRQFVASGHADLFDRLMRAHESVRTYCDCFGHGLAVEGAVGAMVDYNLHIWDVAASEVLIREAGGTYLQINDNARDRKGGRCHVVFGKPTVVAWLRKILQLEATS